MAISLDLDANNSTGGGSDATATFNKGGPGAPIGDVDVLITNSTGTTLRSAVITLGINRMSGDLLSINGTLPAGITASAYNPSTGVLTLDGIASLAAYQTAIHQVVYSTPSQNPSTADRIITVTVSDGTSVSNAGTAFIHVSTASNPPVNAVPGSLAANENTTTPFAGVSVSDADSATLTTTLDVTHGTLGVSAAGGVSVTGNGSGHLILSGSIADLNATLGTLAYTGNANFSGSDSLTVSTSDGGLTDVDTTPITVNAVNAAPVAQNGSAGGSEDIPIGGTLVATDVDSPTLTYRLAGQATHGTVVVNANGTYTYTPNADFNGSDSFTFQANDGQLDSNVARISLTIAPVNDAPVTQDGTADGSEDTPINGTLVAADVDSPTLSYHLVAQAQHGIVTVNPNGSYTYTPNADFNGADSFTFAANDGQVDSNIATVSLTIDPVNDPPAAPIVPNGLTVNEDRTLPIGVSVNDIDSSTLTTVLSVSAGILDVTLGGGAGITGDGTGSITIVGSVAQTNSALAGLSYHPDLNFNGLDQLSVVTSDGQFSRQTAKFISVLPVNDAPVGADNTLTTREDTPYTFHIGDFGFSDVDGNNPLGGTLTTLPTAGVLTLNGTPLGVGDFVGTADVTAGNLVYTPPVNVSGNAVASFTFQVQDDGGTANGGVDTDPTPHTITFNVVANADPPVAQDDSASGNEDTPISGVLVATDPDTPSTSLTYSLFGQAAHGTVVVNPDGTYTYTPDADFNGTDFFLFRANDGALDSNVGTINLTIAPVDDAPVAQSGTADGNEDTPISGTLAASDVDGPALTFSLVAQAANGTVTVNPDGSYTYVPNADFNGIDGFTFKASDGSLDSNIASVALNIHAVNDAPVAQNGSASGSEDTPIGGTLIATDIDGPPLTYTLAGDAAHGAVVVNPNGTYTYTPDADFNGADSFFFRASDGDLNSNVARIDLTTAPVNDAPVTQEGLASGNEDTPITGTLVATDVDSPTLTYSLDGQATNGTVVVNSDGTYTYTPNADYHGTDVFTFKANDGALDSNISVVDLNIHAVDDAPVAQAASASGDEDTPISGTLTATDIDGPTLTFSLTGQAAHGSVVVNPDGSYTYTPDADFNGSDSFIFKANDGTLDSNGATVSLTVDPVDDAPVNILPGPHSLVRLGPSSFNAQGFGVDDVDAGTGVLTTTLSVGQGTITVVPGGAVVTGSGTSSITITGTLADLNAALATVFYDTAPGFSGTDTVVMTTTDNGNTGSGGPLIDTDSLSFTVTNSNQPPTSLALSNNAVNEFSPDGTVVGALTATDPDPGDVLTFTLPDAGSRFAIDGTNLVVRHGLLLDFEQAATYDITVQVADASGLILQQVFTINIGNVDPENIVESATLTGAPGGNTIVGGPLDDRFALGPGNDVITGAAGDDTAVFTTTLAATTPDDFGKWIDIVGADGADRLFTVEHLQFTDGTVNAADGDGLFDTLFYDYHYQDVFHAGVDARQHYETVGWQEGRDPNAFFSTNEYIAAYQAALKQGGSSLSDGESERSDGGSGAGSGGTGALENPLEHYRDTGWREGFDPSLDFDTTLYLIHNPDVAAAGINPLEHFLQFGRAEGRVAYPSIGQTITASGFDAEFYLMSNPDVAAAGVDPLTHYETFGWHEGRNPNRYFDTTGYLAHYADVAAAGIDPLSHYAAFGWQEGRDPSGAFDTLNYLAANVDVAVAHVDPLTHFLQFGIYEGRNPLGDGLFH